MFRLDQLLWMGIFFFCQATFNTAVFLFLGFGSGNSEV